MTDNENEKIVEQKEVSIEPLLARLTELEPLVKEYERLENILRKWIESECSELPVKEEQTFTFQNHILTIKKLERTILDQQSIPADIKAKYSKTIQYFQKKILKI